MKNLKGSEKQVKWAEDLRSDWLQLNEKLIALEEKEANDELSFEEAQTIQSARYGVFRGRYEAQEAQKKEELKINGRAQRRKIPLEQRAALDQEVMDFMADWSEERRSFIMEQDEAKFWIDEYK